MSFHSQTSSRALTYVTLSSSAQQDRQSFTMSSSGTSASNVAQEPHLNEGAKPAATQSTASVYVRQSASAAAQA